METSKTTRVTNIICPECGDYCLTWDGSKIRTSNPPQYKYYCECCGFSHTAYSDVDMMNWINSLDKPIEEEILIEKLMRMRYNSWFGLNPVEKGGTNYHAKQDYGKAKLSLVPRRIIWDVAAIREYGNNKYPDGGPDNWRGVEVERYRDAAYRHFLRYLDDPKSVDSESGLPHLWHLACNIAFLCEMEDRYLSKDPEVAERLKKVFRGYQPPSEEGEEGLSNE